MSKVTIRVDLDELETEKFFAIKEKIGVKNNTEVIRVLIEKAAIEEALV